MTYEKPAVLATFEVEELMKDAAVCTVLLPTEPGRPGLSELIGAGDGATHPSPGRPI